jgi:hypothetical protein
VVKPRTKEPPERAMAREEGPEDEAKPEACAKKRSDYFFFLSVARKACGEAEDEGAAGACDGT